MRLRFVLLVLLAASCKHGATPTTLGRSSNSTSAPAVPLPSLPVSTALPAPSASESMTDRDLLAKISGLPLDAAFRGVRNELSDGKGSVSLGAKAFAKWAVNGLEWSDLMALPATTPREALKDTETQRGKRICAYGRVNNVSVERAAGPPPVTTGMLSTQSDHFLFAASGSTDSIFRGVSARFCGILLETNYEDGTYLVVTGMFDLPANRAKPAPGAAP